MFKTFKPSEAMLEAMQVKAASVDDRKRDHAGHLVHDHSVGEPPPAPERRLYAKPMTKNPSISCGSTAASTAPSMFQEKPPPPPQRKAEMTYSHQKAVNDHKNKKFPRQSFASAGNNVISPPRQRMTKNQAMIMNKGIEVLGKITSEIAPPSRGTRPPSKKRDAQSTSSAKAQQQAEEQSETVRTILRQNAERAPWRGKTEGADFRPPEAHPTFDFAATLEWDPTGASPLTTGGIAERVHMDATPVFGESTTKDTAARTCGEGGRDAATKNHTMMVAADEDESRECSKDLADDHTDHKYNAAIRAEHKDNHIEDGSRKQEDPRERTTQNLPRPSSHTRSCPSLQQKQTPPDIEAMIAPLRRKQPGSGMALTLPAPYKFAATPVPSYARCPPNYVRKIRMKDETPVQTRDHSSNCLLASKGAQGTVRLSEELREAQRRLKSKKQLVNFYTNSLLNHNTRDVNALLQEKIR